MDSGRWSQDRGDETYCEPPRARLRAEEKGKETHSKKAGVTGPELGPSFRGWEYQRPEVRTVPTALLLNTKPKPQPALNIRAQTLTLLPQTQESRFPRPGDRDPQLSILKLGHPDLSPLPQTQESRPQTYSYITWNPDPSLSSLRLRGPSTILPFSDPKDSSKPQPSFLDPAVHTHPPPGQGSRSFWGYSGS